jgi:hypothetical protein
MPKTVHLASNDFDNTGLRPRLSRGRPAPFAKTMQAIQAGRKEVGVKASQRRRAEPAFRPAEV